MPITPVNHILPPVLYQFFYQNNKFGCLREGVRVSGKEKRKRMSFANGKETRGSGSGGRWVCSVCFFFSSLFCFATLCAAPPLLVLYMHWTPRCVLFPHTCLGRHKKGAGGPFSCFSNFPRLFPPTERRSSCLESTHPHTATAHTRREHGTGHPQGLLLFFFSSPPPLTDAPNHASPLQATRNGWQRRCKCAFRWYVWSFFFW